MALNNQDISYKSVLGLQKDPFSPEPDPAFYYSFDSFEQRLQVLQGLVQGADILALVIGEPGSGKTTLLNRYLASTDAELKTVRIIADPDTASPRTTETLEREGYPAYILQDSESPIVIVDDSHKLPQKELAFLLQEALVPDSAHKIKRLVLFGESELYTRVTRLAETYAAQPAVNKIYLPGLTEKQTGAYLQHRLAAAGHAGKNPFNTSAIKHIHQTSGGYPGAVNEIASQWLEIKYSTKEEGQGMLQHFSAPPRRVAVWIAAGVIVILLAALWYFPGRETAKPKPSDQKKAKIVFRKKMPRERQSTDTVIRKKAAAAKTATESSTEIMTPQPAAVETSTQPTAEIKTQQPTSEETALPQTPVTAPEEKKTPQPAAEETSTQPTAAIKTQQPITEETVLPQTPVTAPEEKEAPQKIEIQPEPPPSTLAKADTEADQRTVRRERWLLSQDATSYTIQIIGVHKEQSLFDFIKKNQLLQQNEIAYYESTFQGKAWYQLLYGVYPTKQAAEEAADKLAENIRRAGPWIRRLSTIQKAIEERGIQ
ncbi:MAG: SPOR domain-containing protein [Desulfobacterales bacterium]|nr:MAG: SPOR domain-containing protein [Desulfobacterales bacterium]